MPSLRALCISSQSRSKCRFMRLMSSCTCSALTVWPSSTTTAKNVAVGMIGIPLLATASRSRSVNLVFRQHLRLARAAVRHLDEVDAVFALPPDLGDHLVRGVAELADGVIGRSLP